MNWKRSFGHGCVILLFCLWPLLTACAPDSVPRDASHEWDFINGSIWYWEDKLPNGCAAWMASERWVSVQLLPDPDCSGDVRHDRVTGPRLSTDDYRDELDFMEFGPWNSEIRDSLTVYDEMGKFLGFKPCPHSITKNDLILMSQLALDASKIATTDAEKELTKRIMTRLKSIDLEALSSSLFGCTDLPLRRPPKNGDTP